MIGVFARADHPKGYGFADGRAHGYVILFVRCKSRKQVLDVLKVLTNWKKPFLGLGTDQYYNHGNLGEWFGGNAFDLLAVLPGNKLDHMSGGYYTGGGTQPAPGRFFCRGDNRFTGIYEAGEILDQA